MKEKPWGGRFTKSGSAELEAYWNSIPFDWKLFRQDISGSIAHARMLGACGIISKEESAQIIEGLGRVRERIERGEVNFDIHDEDIHMAVEKLLREDIGAVAGKLHTARSRNDQVALDMHLFVREACAETVELCLKLQSALLAQAEANLDTILPGYTHLQRAQPVSFAHHLLVYVWQLSRDIERFRDTYRRTNLSPLGAGALAGTTFPIDPTQVAQELNFSGCYENSMDAVSDRDFSLEYLANSSILMMHLSRLCEEVLLWTSFEFGFVTLDDAFSTGSSIMPQKKNSDLAELVRGKTGRVYGALVGLLTVLKGLPLTYNKDMQEDKEGVFDVVQTVTGALQHLSGMIETMTVHPEVMRRAAEGNFTNATDVADYLAKRGLPFREAHEVAGKMVLSCLKQGKELLELRLEEFKQFSSLFEQDVFDALQVEQIVSRRNSRSGTAKEQVVRQIGVVKERRKEIEQWLGEVAVKGQGGAKGYGSG